MIRRSAGLAAIVLSVLGLLLCLAGVAGVWAAKGWLDTVVAASFATADDAFDFLDTRLDRVKQSVDKSRERPVEWSKIADRLTSPETDLSAESQPLLQALDTAYDELQSAQHWLESSHAVARGVNRMSEAIATSRAESSPDPSAGVNATKIAEFSDGVADALARLQVLRQELIDLREKKTLAREFAARWGRRLTELDEKLATLSGRIDAFDTRVSTSRTSCADLGRSVHWWIGFAAIVLTLVLLWFAATQVGMMVHGWRLGRRSADTKRVLPRVPGG